MRQRALNHVAGPAEVGNPALADPANLTQTRAQMKTELKKLRAAPPPKPTEHWAVARVKRAIRSVQ